jgi:hypothetical protein
MGLGAQGTRWQAGSSPILPGIIAKHYCQALLPGNIAKHPSENYNCRHDDYQPGQPARQTH